MASICCLSVNSDSFCESIPRLSLHIFRSPHPVFTPLHPIFTPLHLRVPYHSQRHFMVVGPCAFTEPLMVVGPCAFTEPLMVVGTCAFTEHLMVVGPCTFTEHFMVVGPCAFTEHLLAHTSYGEPVGTWTLARLFRTLRKRASCMLLTPHVSNVM
jgi:hypothetical protein